MYPPPGHFTMFIKKKIKQNINTPLQKNNIIRKQHRSKREREKKLIVSLNERNKVISGPKPFKSMAQKNTDPSLFC